MHDLPARFLLPERPVLGTPWQEQGAYEIRETEDSVITAEGLIAICEQAHNMLDSITEGFRRQPAHRCPIGRAKGRLRVYQTIPPELLHPEMFIPAATLLGLLLGSFYNVCIHRYVSGESILFPPSHCPHCNQRLRFWELIPVLSYLLLRGQCARCHKPIHIRYPLVELLSGLTSGLLAWRFGPTLAFPVYLVFTGMLIVASGIDLECFILPDGITLGGTMLAVPAAIFALGMDWTDALLGGLVGGGTFLAVLLVFKRLRGVDGMGFGDVKLMLMLGVLCGPLGLPLITLVAGVSALAAFLLIACLMPREAPLREMPIPFGPFLSLGAFVHILAGQEILDWWIRFITG